MKALYEVDEVEDQDLNLAEIEKLPEMWRYRPRVTIDHLTQVFYIL